MSYQKDARKLARELIRKGWKKEMTGTGHYRLTHPNGSKIVFACSPSCHRWLKNTMSDIRKIEQRHA